MPPLPPTATPATVSATASPAAAPIAELLSRVDEAKLREHMESLAEMGSRYPGTEGHAQAARYIEQVLRSFSSPIVAAAPRGAPESGPRNVFALYGPVARGDAAPRIILGAHYDSIAERTPGWSRETDPAPGANDNGTGVAGLLEIARVLAEQHHAGHLAKEVAVVFFDEEELRMRGSLAWVGGAFPRLPEVMLNLDMVGFSAPGRRKLDVVRYGNSGDLPERLRAANARYALGLQLVDRHLPVDLSTWVDSTPFAQAGVRAVSLTESYGQPGIDYPGYPGFHRVSDTPDQLNNLGQWKAATQLLLAVAVELAR